MIIVVAVLLWLLAERVREGLALLVRVGAVERHGAGAGARAGHRPRAGFLGSEDGRAVARALAGLEAGQQLGVLDVDGAAGAGGLDRVAVRAELAGGVLLHERRLVGGALKGAWLVVHGVEKGPVLVRVVLALAVDGDGRLEREVLERGGKVDFAVAAKPDLRGRG